MASVYRILEEYPGASYIPSTHLTKLTNLLKEASKGHYDRNTAIKFMEATHISIGSIMPTKSLELKHAIKLFFGNVKLFYTQS